MSQVQTNRDLDQHGQSLEAASGRICWRREMRDGVYRGWLNETGADGFSFIVGASVQPEVGQIIRVDQQATGEGRFRILQTTAYDEHLVLVVAERVGREVAIVDAGRPIVH